MRLPDVLLRTFPLVVHVLQQSAAEPALEIQAAGQCQQAVSLLLFSFHDIAIAAGCTRKLSRTIPILESATRNPRSLNERNCCDARSLVPAQAVGFEDLTKRIKEQAKANSEYQKKLEARAQSLKADALSCLLRFAGGAAEADGHEAESRADNESADSGAPKNASRPVAPSAQSALSEKRRLC